MEGWRGGFFTDFLIVAWYVPCLASHETLQELCRKENLRCKSIGITNKSLKSYEVEYLCDYKVEEVRETQTNVITLSAEIQKPEPGSCARDVKQQGGKCEAVDDTKQNVF
ncbi:UNVERIFIED_CONTAM: hypothetical protein H355_003212 [Colinus virginianus]|nr:hypothetical protein H355_003212 [Colinus virginianus]